MNFADPGSKKVAPCIQYEPCNNRKLANSSRVSTTVLFLHFSNKHTIGGKLIDSKINKILYFRTSVHQNSNSKRQTAANDRWIYIFGDGCGGLLLLFKEGCRLQSAGEVRSGRACNAIVNCPRS